MTPRAAFHLAARTVCTSPLEAQNSLASIAAGVVFFFNGYASGSFYAGNEHLYAGMGFLPLCTWATFYAGAGLLHLAAVTFHWHRTRKNVLLVKSVLWLFLAVLFVQDDPLSLAPWFCFLFCLSALFAYLKFSEDKDALGPRAHTAGL
jgi:hypothetical protein